MGANCLSRNGQSYRLTQSGWASQNVLPFWREEEENLNLKTKIPETDNFPGDCLYAGGLNIRVPEKPESQARIQKLAQGVTHDHPYFKKSTVVKPRRRTKVVDGVDSLVMKALAEVPKENNIRRGEVSEEVKKTQLYKYLTAPIITPIDHRRRTGEAFGHNMVREIIASASKQGSGSMLVSKQAFGMGFGNRPVGMMSATTPNFGTVPVRRDTAMRVRRMPENIQNGGTLPESIQNVGRMPENVQNGGTMPCDSNIQNGGTMPSNCNIQNGGTMPSNSNIQNGGTMPCDSNIQNGGTMPCDSNIQNGGTMPCDSNIQNGGTMPSNCNIQNGGTMPSNCNIQNGGTMPSNCNIQNGGTMPYNSNIQNIETMPSNIQNVGKMPENIQNQGMIAPNPNNTNVGMMPANPNGVMMAFTPPRRAMPTLPTVNNPTRPRAVPPTTSQALPHMFNNSMPEPVLPAPDFADLPTSYWTADQCYQYDLWWQQLPSCQYSSYHYN